MLLSKKLKKIKHFAKGLRWADVQKQSGVKFNKASSLAVLNERYGIPAYSPMTTPRVYEQILLYIALRELELQHSSQQITTAQIIERFCELAERDILYLTSVGKPNKKL